MQLAEYVSTAHPVVEALRAIWCPGSVVDKAQIPVRDLQVLARIRWAMQQFVNQDNSILGLTDTREYLEDYGRLPLELSDTLFKLAQELESETWRVLVWVVARGDLRRAR